MPCINLPKIPYPPGLELLLPQLHLEIPVPGIGISLCCTYQLLPFTIPILPIGLIPGVAVTLQPAMTAILAAIDTLNSLLDSIPLKCPLE